MKKIIALMVALLVVPVVLATDTGSGVGITFDTEEFCPLIWLCDHRVVVDDPVEPGRVDGENYCSNKDEFENFDEEVCDEECCVQYKCEEWKTTSACSGCTDNKVKNGECPATCCKTFKDTCHDWMGCFLLGDELIERHGNYAFEGEKIRWKVLVMDKNKIEEIDDVVAIFDEVPEVECLRLAGYGAEVGIMDSCNARIGEEELIEFDDQIMDYYECTLTVETPENMYGEEWVTIEAIDEDMDTMCDPAVIDESEYWFMNPTIALGVDGTINFGTVRPGTVSYSDTVLLENGAESDSEVSLDVFISGTDFYSDSEGARCVITNRLKLGDNYVAGGDSSNDNKCEIGFSDTDDHLCYMASTGAYSTLNDARSDAEGYAPIVYGDAFSRDMYNDAEIIQANPMGAYWGANILEPGEEIAITMKLGLPEPCVGDFDDGQIYFWGEAI